MKRIALAVIIAIATTAPCFAQPRGLLPFRRNVRAQLAPRAVVVPQAIVVPRTQALIVPQQQLIVPQQQRLIIVP